MKRDELLDVAALQVAVSAAGATWTPGETALTALPLAQRRRFLGAEPPGGSESLDDRETAAAANAALPVAYAAGARAAAPAAVDLRNYVRPVRNQGSCGSCVAFGTIAAIEGTARVAAANADLAIDLSEAQLFYCHGGAEGRNCDNGWWPDQALNASRDKGLVDEACFPYTAGDQACSLCGDSQSRTYKIVSWTALQTADAMKTWLATKGPLAACFKVYDDFYAYRSGVYRHVSGAFLGGHCVSVVGYNDNDRAWIAKNSWGTNWGESGYFRIGYGDSGVDFAMWGVEVPKGEQVEWLKRQSVTGVWAITETRNAAAYLAGVGWKHIGGSTDQEFLALLTQLQSARASKTLVDVRLASNKIVEVYVF